MNVENLKCKACEESALGFCFAHIPAGYHGENHDSTINFETLWGLLRSISNHEALKITKANAAWNKDVIGCGVCLEPWVSHDKDCLVLNIWETLGKSEPNA